MELKTLKKVGFVIGFGCIIVLLNICYIMHERMKKDGNLFNYFIEYENGIFAPKQVDFGMSFDEAAAERQIDTESVIDGLAGKRIVTSFSMENIQSNIDEILSFYKNELTGVEYVLKADAIN